MVEVRAAERLKQASATRRDAFVQEQGVGHPVAQTRAQWMCEPPLTSTTAPVT
jgi:hypothetical protein